MVNCRGSDIFLGIIFCLVTIDIIDACESSVFVSFKWLPVICRLDIFESFDDTRRMLAEVVSVIASFKDNNHLRANLEQLSCHVIVGERAEV